MASETTNSQLTKREADVFEAFKYLDKTRGTPTQTELAMFLKCHPATVNRAIGRLEEKGCMGATKVKKNRSARSYRVTNFRRAKKAVRQ